MSSRFNVHIVYVHNAKIAKENGFTLQFCSNYPPKMSRIGAMYVFLTNYNTFRGRFLLRRKEFASLKFYKWKGTGDNINY